jgi:lytic cellulose monooxygenase (C1-hydroxylating)
MEDQTKALLGPIIYYLAKVNDAASTGTTGLQWFKVAHDGLANGKWAVDTMIANNGWHYFTLPSCVAPGDYLLRAELIALHSAGNQGQAQCKCNDQHLGAVLTFYSLYGMCPN